MVVVSTVDNFLSYYKNEFAKKENKRIRNHINGIENFWGSAKVRLSKFRGVNKDTFYLHLKECEFRCKWRGGRDSNPRPPA